MSSATSFLPAFDARWLPAIGCRSITFRTAIQELERKPGPYLIAETGSMREPPGTANALSDGSSTMLWDEVVTHHGGIVRVFEIDLERCMSVAAHVTPLVHIHGGDAVARLRELSPASVDLLYLDSYDVEWHNPHPSALHHLMEMASAAPALRPGCLVLIDDCGPTGGKGLYVSHYLGRIGATLIASEYQQLWRMP